MDDVGDVVFAAFVGLALAMVVFVVGLKFGESNADKAFELRAVAAGVATYEPDEDGNPRFVFKGVEP